MLFEAKNIVFRYPGAEETVLERACLCLRSGERLGLLGDNGSGKSTLLHIGAGLLQPQAGQVSYHGTECRTEKDFANARRWLGYLLQRSEDQLFCPTVLEDVAFGPVNRGTPEDEAFFRAETILEELGINHLGPKNGSRLSGGERKLAALATILVMEPEFLFLDEPTNDLSAGARKKLLDVLERVKLPLVAISHDRDFLKRVCNRYVIMQGGGCKNLETGLPSFD